jgi:hypothetical protein
MGVSVFAPVTSIFLDPFLSQLVKKRFQRDAVPQLRISSNMYSESHTLAEGVDEIFTRIFYISRPI